MPQGTTKKLKKKKKTGAGGGGHALWGSIPASGPKRCQYVSQLLRTITPACSGALASKDAALGSAPSFEKLSSSCLSDSRNNFQRLSLQLPCSSPGEAEAKVTSPGPLPPALGPLCGRTRFPGTLVGRGPCTLPAHTGPPSHLGGLWHPQAQPSHHCLRDMSKRMQDPKSQENKVSVTSQVPGCVRGKYTD